MARRLLLVLIASFLALGIGARPAAAVEPDPWWLPSSWLEVAAGVGADALSLFGAIGGSGSVSVTAGAETFVTSETPLVGFTPYSQGTQVYVWSLLSVDPVKGPRFWRTYVGCVVGGGNFVCTNSAYAPVADGYPTSQTSNRSIAVFADGYEAAVDIGGAVDGYFNASMLASPVAVHGPLVGMRGPSTQSSTVRVTPWVWVASAEIATTTTAVTCRDGAGVDTVVSETVSGLDVAPRPVCPAGSWAVRVVVTNSVDGVVSDSSVTAPDWYLADPGGTTWGRYSGGTLCVPGDTRPSCSGAWVDGVNTCVAMGRESTMILSGDGAMVPRTVDPALCQERIASGLPVDGGVTVEVTVDSDNGVVVRAIEKLGEVVKSTSSTLAGTVRALQTAVKAEGASTRSTVETAAEGLRSKLDEVADRIVAAVVASAADTGLGDKIDDLGTKIEGIGSGTDSGNPCDPGSYSLTPGDFVYKPLACLFTPTDTGMARWSASMGGAWEKFEPLDGQIHDIAGQFSYDSASCSCEGFRMALPYPIGDVYLAQSCSGPLAVAAAATRMGTSAVLVIGVAGSFIRFVAIAFGYVGLISSASSAAGRDDDRAGG